LIRGVHPAVRIILAACGVAVSAGSTALHAQRITLDDVVRSASLGATAPAAVQWSSDGRTLAFTWDSSGGRLRDVWLTDRDGANRRQLTRFARGGRAGGVREMAWMPDGEHLALFRSESLLVVNTRAGETRPMAVVGAESQELRVSPRGDMAAYVEAGDLWIVALDGSAPPRRLTSVGVPTIATTALGTYARADREIGSATWGSGAPNLTWSPDGRTLAVHVVDRRALRRVPFPSYLGRETQANELRRSYPGDANESRQVALVDAVSGAMTMLPFERSTEIQVTNIAWSSRGELLVDRESDDATERWVHVVTPGAEPRQIYHDRRDSRIYSEFGSAWSLDGRQVLLTTDRDDRYRVFALTPGDTTLTPLTPSTSDVQGAAVPLPDGGIAWLAGTPSPSDRQVWRARPGQPPVRLTLSGGTPRPFVSPDGDVVASIVSNDITPPMLIVETEQGGRGRVIAGPAWRQLPTSRLVQARYRTFAGAAVGETLSAKMWLPAAADSGKRVPVIFGPLYSNTVRNRWGGVYGMLQQYLVQQGYAVIQVDVRGSTGYGRAFREAFLFEWGGKDLDDLAATKRWLGTQPWADTARTGIFGSSYGGLITVYGLFRRPGLFKAGVAGAAATDPRFFGSDDVAITRRPGTHPDAFTRGALQYAGGLQDHLMLIHGMMDDVVPFKTTADLAEELMRLGKDFDLVTAPGATHAWTARPQHARFLLGKLVQHFDRYIGSTPTTDAVKQPARRRPATERRRPVPPG
jgi:dipeptidyl-peptidase 4